MFRAGYRSILIVGLASAGLAMQGTGSVDPRWFSGFRAFGRDLVAAVSDARTGLTGMVAAKPETACAGPPCVLLAGDGYVLGLDREGSIASCDTASGRFDLPVLTGVVPASTTVGHGICSAEVIIGLEIVRAFDAKPEMMKMLSEVNLANLDDPRAILAGGVVVDLGGGDYRQKVDKLSQVLLHLKGLNASPKTIDLRFARQVVVTCNEPHRSIAKEV
jgi:hypothetical protein